MNRIVLSLVCLWTLLFAPFTWASDACSDRAILTSADVTVSDGSAFEIQSYFHSKEATAIQHIRDETQTVAVEGPLGWARRGDDTQAGGDAYKQFALGHQYHALLLYFDDIVSNVRQQSEVPVRGTTYTTVAGDYPFGGTLHRIDDESKERPAGMILVLPDAGPIDMFFLDWKSNGQLELPFHVRIDDGERVFDYRYTRIEVAPRSPLWFFEAIQAPAIDEVQVYRLHRKLLAAHCLGDADMMAKLSAPEVTAANRGELRQSSNQALRERFAALFERLDYTAYYDLAPPVIETSESSDLGWILANVRAVGSDRKTGALFDDQWAWAMLVRKIDGVWLHAGNASNAAD